MKYLIIGAVVIEWLLFKNLQMLKKGTGENGNIYLTAPDIIEVSTLT